MNKVMVDKARLLRRVIVISWISLALCFVVKIFGGNFFEIMCNNPNYKSLCEYAESHYWLNFVLQFSSSFYCQIFYMLAISKRYKMPLWEFLLTFIVVSISCPIRYFIPSCSIIFDIAMLFILPMISIKWNFRECWQILIAFILTLLFQVISLFTKNLSLKIIDDSTFISLIYMIDIYIMCFLYYLYRNYEKEKTNMGAFWVLFAGKPVDKLKEMKAKREKQIAKLNEEVKAIEEAIKAQADKK